MATFARSAVASGQTMKKPVGTSHRQIAERLDETTRSQVVGEKCRAGEGHPLTRGRRLKRHMRERKSQAAFGVDAGHSYRGEPTRPVDLVGNAPIPLVVQQDVMREVGRLVKSRPARQELRAADGVEVFTHQQVATQPLLGSRAGPNGDVDLFAREVGQRHGRQEAYVKLGMPLGQAAEARNKPTRHHRWHGADRQHMGCFETLQIGGRRRQAGRAACRRVQDSGRRPRSPRRPGQPPKQRDTQPVLEKLDQTPHGIGGNIEFGSRGVEASEARRCLEGADCVERRQSPMALTQVVRGNGPL